MHVPSHAVLIGEYGRRRALTTFAFDLNVTVNGSTRRRYHKGRAEKRSSADPRSRLVSPHLRPTNDSPPQPSLPRPRRRRARAPLDGVDRRFRGIWVALQQGLHRDAHPPTFLEVRRFHTLDEEVTLARAFAKAVIHVNSQSFESRAPQDLPHPPCPAKQCTRPDLSPAVLTGHDFCFTVTNLPSAIAIIGPMI